METPAPHERLAAFLACKGWSQSKAGAELGCSQVTVSCILRGTKLPGRLLANEIERVTADWADGPIRSEEWDAVERERREVASTTSARATAMAQVAGLPDAPTGTDG